MTLTEEILLKYADGKLDDEHVRSVESQLRHDDVAGERLRLIRLSGNALDQERLSGRAAFAVDELADRILRDAPEEEPAPYLSGASAEEHASSAVTPVQFGASRPARRWMMGAIAASLLFCVAGIAAGYIGARSFGEIGSSAGQDMEMAGVPTWIARVVDYHTLYDRETVGTSKASPDDVVRLQARFSDLMQQTITVPDLDATDLEFRRGQVLKFRGSPIVQLAYLPDRTGRPVALCLTPSSQADSAPSYSELRGMGVVRWTRDKIDYVMVGYLPEQRLMTSARSAAEQI